MAPQTIAQRRIAALRPHEARVLYYAARGLTTTQIARFLGVSRSTVVNARYRAYITLDVRTGLAATVMLLRAAQRAGRAQEADDGLSAAGHHRAAMATVAGTPRDRAA